MFIDFVFFCSTLGMILVMQGRMFTLVGDCSREVCLFGGLMPLVIGHNLILIPAGTVFVAFRLIFGLFYLDLLI